MSSPCRGGGSSRVCVAGTAAVLAWLWIPPASAGDWPQFRGRTGQGIAADEDGDAPISFGPSDSLRWKTLVPGRGWSSPVVLDGLIWLTTAENEGKSLRALSFDLENGALRHNVELFTPENPVPINAKNSHASPTPVLAPGRVFVHFGTMGTACLESTTGRVLWKNSELVFDHQEGPGSSPILHGDLLIVHCDGRDHQDVVALRTDTGKVAWKTPRSAPLRSNTDFRKAFCTPLVIDVDGRPQLISPGADQTHAYDPATGRELWHVRYIGFSNVPRPVFGNGTVFLCTGYMKPELWALQPGGTGDVSETAPVWKHAKQVPANPSPVLVGDLLFFVSDGGIATCLESATGKPLWQQRLGGNFWASPVAVGDRLYFPSEEGAVHVLRASREFEPLATNDLKERIMASPAVVDGSFIVRTDPHLYRFGNAVAGGKESGDRSPETEVRSGEAGEIQSEATDGVEEKPGEATSAEVKVPEAAPWPKKEFECRRAKSPLVIDGVADEEAWKNAEVIDNFAPFWLKTADAPARKAYTKTTARLLWDEKYLYFHADMEDADLYADVIEQDGDCWNNDVFELFFKPSDKSLGYYEFEVTANNTHLDMFVPSRGSGGFLRWGKAHEFKWETNVVRRGTINDPRDRDKGWSVEGRIPWEDFIQKQFPIRRGLANQKWKFTLCRYDYSVDFEQPELSACAPLTRPDYHRYEDYATLVFVDP